MISINHGQELPSPEQQDEPDIDPEGNRSNDECQMVLRRGIIQNVCCHGREMSRHSFATPLGPGESPFVKIYELMLV